MMKQVPFHSRVAPLVLGLLVAGAAAGTAQERSPGLLFGFGVGAGVVDPVGINRQSDFGLDLVGRTGARLGRRFSLVIEGDLHHVNDATPLPEDQLTDRNPIYETTHLLFGPQIDIAGGFFVRPAVGLGIHTREIFFNCPPVDGPCSGVGTSTEGGEAAGMTVGYAIATASWLDLVIEAAARFSSTEAGDRATYGLRAVTTLRPGS